MVNSGNTYINKIHYQGYDIKMMYACGGELVWSGDTPPTPPTPPTGDKLNYNLSGSTYTVNCNESDVLTIQELYNSLPQDGKVSAITDAEIGSCVSEIGQLCFTECYSLSSVTIPNTVTKIDYQAFYNCHSLSSLTIPNGVTVISDYVVKGCDNLSTFNIPSGVTSIGMHSFYDCLSYLDITIPSGVTNIGDSAFRTEWYQPQDADYYQKMMYLKDHRVIRCLAVTPPQIGSTVFAIISGNDDIATYKIYVPAESVEAYKTAWSEYASRIQAMP